MKILFLLLLNVLLPAQSDFPKKIGAVNDHADIISQATENIIATLSRELNEKTGFSYVVVTYNPKEEIDIEDYSNRLYEKWGIGKKGIDEGVLLLVLPEQRKIRFETGYGAESFLTDAFLSSIINERIIPEIQKGSFDRAIGSGSASIIGIVAQHYNVTISGIRAPQNKTNTDSSQLPLPAVIFMVIVFVILASTRTGRALLIGMMLNRAMGGRSGYSGSSSFGGRIGGGGFGGGFGGGLSGGGGASGRW